MCGIVGAVLQRHVTPILLEGLKRMEYRGYDSAGLAVLDASQSLKRVRAQGKVATLVDAVKGQPLESHIGIAHTRWATHGVPSEQNAHPHISGDEHHVAVVHNGIIENFETLKTQLQERGYTFSSDTDTEVIVHLIYDHMQKGLDFKNAVRATSKELKGAFSLGVLSSQHPDCVITMRQGSPLVIGVGFEENYFASDYLALLPVTQQFMYLQEGDLAEVRADTIKVYDSEDNIVEREVKTFTADAYLNTEKGPYRHYMQKEIFQQPQVLLETLQGRISENNVLDAAFGHKAVSLLEQIKNVHIVACGTSYHNGLVAKYWLESLAKISCSVEISSEYRYRDVVVPKDTLFIVISQSGETADTLAALRKAKESGYLSTLAICNVPESAMIQEADLSLLTRAGPEVGVASTKAFTTQLVSLALFVLALAKRNGVEDIAEHVQALKALPKQIDDLLKVDALIQDLAPSFSDKTSSLFLARGSLFPIVLEGALKLKEISYIHAEAYPAGELKHGPLALVDDNMPVIAIVHKDVMAEKILANLQEVRARGGQLIIFTNIENLNFPDATVIELPQVSQNIFAAPVAYTIPLQLLAYHVAVHKGTDVDQPRNLAKSVTVE
jgi:glucosamine--fructose-6-phosphate aminotransferase (isomerizing)